MKHKPDPAPFFVGEPLPPLPESILGRGQRREYPRHGTITPGGDEVDGLFYLESGLVRVLRSSLSGARRTLFIVSGGHFFFEAHYFHTPALFSQAEVVLPAGLVFFPHRTAKELLGTEESFRDRVFRSLSCKALLMGTELMEGAYADRKSVV